MLKYSCKKKEDLRHKSSSRRAATKYGSRAYNIFCLILKTAQLVSRTVFDLLIYHDACQ